MGRVVPGPNFFLTGTKNDWSRSCLAINFMAMPVFNLLSLSLVNDIIDCSNIICNTVSINSSICPPDSYFLEDQTPIFRTSLSLSKNLSSICCERRGQCVCSPCPKIQCGENSIIQIYRTGNPNILGQCCDQYNCIKSR